MATGDKTGNLILWRITNNTFKTLAEINNLSESNITNITWSPFGDFIYVCNNNGSIYTIELGDSFKTEPSNFHMEISKQINSNNINNINNLNNFNNINNNPLFSLNDNNNINNINNINNDIFKRKKIIPNYINDESLSQNNINNSYNNRNHNNNDACNLCKIMHFEDIQTKKVVIKIDLAFELSSSFIWENKVNSYYSYTELIINNKILFYNYLEGRFIKDFACNNFVHVYYDTNNLLHISSLLNTKVIKIKQNKIKFIYF